MGRCASECLNSSLQAPGTAQLHPALGRAGKQNKQLHKLSIRSPTRTIQTPSDCWQAVHPRLYRRHPHEIESDNCATNFVALRPTASSISWATPPTVTAEFCVRLHHFSPRELCCCRARTHFQAVAPSSTNDKNCSGSSFAQSDCSRPQRPTQLAHTFAAWSTKTWLCALTQEGQGLGSNQFPAQGLTVARKQNCYN